MGFFEAIKHVFKNYATIRGRARRSEYWYFWLFNFIISCIPSILVFFNALSLIEDIYSNINDYIEDGFNSSDLLVSGFSVFSEILLFLIAVYNIAAIIPRICVSIRRLHDTGRSGWYYLLNYAHIIPLILMLAVASMGAVSGSLFLYFIWTIVWIVSQIMLLVFYIQDGQPGANQYGENPKNSGNVQASQMKQNFPQDGHMQYGADPYAFSHPQNQQSPYFQQTMQSRRIPQREILPTEPVRRNVPQIIGLRGPCQGQAFEMEPGQNTYIIGRDPKIANIIVPDKYVGRNHCSVMFNYDRSTFCIIDNSTNGVFDSSGQRLQTQRIYEFPRGSSIRLVNEDIEFLLQ